MPFSSTADLPGPVKKALPAAAERIWMSAFNSAYNKSGSDSKAAKIAWGAVKNAGYRKGKSGAWVKGK